MNSIINKHSLSDLSLPLFSGTAACGFPSPADDYVGHDLDLNLHLIKHPAATFFVRAQGESMREIGILNGDLLVIDRSLTPKHDSVVLAVINGEFTVKRLKIIAGEGFLCPANKNYRPIPIADLEDLQLWGVVTHAIHALCSG